ncbi:MAG: hypothetical protein GTO17_07000 [Candidatus Aminicenantes bacterium]|nr:hypothetical protein [Candidatus Aminicenantes bacterium]
MNIKDLTSADFPDLDREKFEEWKALTLRLQKAPLIALAIMVGVGFVTISLIGGAIGWLLPVIAWWGYMIAQLPTKKLQAKLTKELGIKREQLKAKQEQ